MTLKRIIRKWFAFNRCTVNFSFTWIKFHHFLVWFIRSSFFYVFPLVLSMDSFFFFICFNKPDGRYLKYLILIYLNNNRMKYKGNREKKMKLCNYLTFTRPKKRLGFLKTLLECRTPSIEMDFYLSYRIICIEYTFNYYISKLMYYYLL